jgi:uncharacterized protein (DUF1800 family)
MNLRSRCFAPALAFLLILQALPIARAAQQPAQQFEQFVARVRDALKLNEEQVGQLRQTLARHETKITELRRRAQAAPFAPSLLPEIEKEQTAIREELAAFLSDEQKAKLSSVDARALFPLPPPFVLINIPPRSRMNATGPASLSLASRERLIAAPPLSNKARLTEDQRALHLLNRITFGPRPGDLDRIKQIGIDKFLDEQLHPEAIDDSELEKRLAVLPTQQMTPAEAYQFYPPSTVVEQRANEKNAPPVFGRPQQIAVERVQQKLVRAVSTNRQMQEVMTDFWFNHFNVFASKEAVQWFATSYERDAIRPRSLGKFRDLLLATAESPAMLYYLDNWLSSAPDAREPRPPRPGNPPPQVRETPKQAPGANSAAVASTDMQAANEKAKMVDDAGLLARIGGPGQTEKDNLKSQNPNPNSAAPPPKNPPAAQAQRRRDINENYARELMELHTLGVDGGYTQKDVQEVARCFTGWTIDRPFQGGGFVFRPWMHDAGSKTVLGVTIPAGGGMSDGLRVIDILARHPSTARFISKKLCERFIADDPPPQAVERAAQVFMKTDGDIREVLRAILTSPEFYSASAFRAKVKSPLELAASAIRAVDGDTNGAPALHEWLRKMGEPLYQNAFPTGYGERSAVWMNTGVFLNRLNFVVALANNQIPGASYDPARLASANEGAEQLAAQLSALIIHTELSAESRRAITDGLAQQRAQSGANKPEIVLVKTSAQTDANAIRRSVAQMIGLLFGAAEFQRR